MTVEAIKDALHVTPFVPFALEVVGGKRFNVRHPDFVAVSPGGGTMTLYTDGENSVVLDVALISQLERRISEV